MLWHWPCTLHCVLDGVSVHPHRTAWNIGLGTGTGCGSWGELMAFFQNPGVRCLLMHGITGAAARQAGRESDSFEIKDNLILAGYASHTFFLGGEFPFVT